MDAADLLLAVRWTARLSALLFGVALIVPVFLPTGQRQRLPVWTFLAFVVAHTIHFAFVLGLLFETGGEGMFPGGRDVADAGGLPAVFGIFTFFYLLAGLALAERRAGPNTTAGVRWAGRIATAFLGYMFVSTFIPLIQWSLWYCVPAIGLTIAVLLNLLAEEGRQLGCPKRAR